MQLEHARLPRRAALQAGAVGLLGLGMNHLAALQGMGATTKPKAKSVIYIFLSGGLSQLDSFDLKPEAPDTTRGEFNPISTATPGLQICEHLPMLAARSDKWAVVRSMAHGQPEHSAGHMLMLTGRSTLPPRFKASGPDPSDWPSIAAIANTVTKPRNNLPPAVVLPEMLIHRTGRTIPGQFAGEMGAHRDPMFLGMAPYYSLLHGAWPQYGFQHAEGATKPERVVFQAPNLSLAEGVDTRRFNERLDLLKSIGLQQRALEKAAEQEDFDRHRQRAIALLSDRRTQQAFNLDAADPKLRERYGENTFGWSLLVARQLVEAGVNLVQVNLGNNETWDNHGNIFPNLKDFLLPPTDRAVSALIDDLAERGLLDDTLVVMAGEMGRTPRISKNSAYKLPGRDHWGTQSVWFAGGGVRGGTVIGATDKIGAYPSSDPQTPERMAATIYRALGIPRELAWHDISKRPHFVYHGDPIAGLMG
jgi:uncharacterized protein (DUF1501 family)